MLKEALRGVLSDEELEKLYSSFDLVGDIAVVKVPEELRGRGALIGEAIIKCVKHVKTVLGQVGPVSGELRLRELEHLAGEPRTETIYKEHGCRFKVDLAKVYFSPRLSYERMRVASQVGRGEVVVNMFAGVGTYSILIAKLAEKTLVYSIDVNPAAHRLTVENVKLNKVSGRVVPVLGEAGRVVRDVLEGSASRVLMPLPERAKEFLGDAVRCLRRGGGVIHYYTHKHGSKPEALTDAEREVKAVLREEVKVLSARVVREVGPRLQQVVLDLRVLKNG